MTKAVARSAADVALSDSDRQRLTLWIRGGTTPQRVVRRARIVVLAGDGLSVRVIAGRLHVAPRTVTLWRRRFQQHGADVLWRDAPGRGRKRSIGIDAASRLRALLETTPPHGARWTIRILAHETGISRASVHRIMRAFQTETPGQRPLATGRRQLPLRPMLSAKVAV